MGVDTLRFYAGILEVSRRMLSSAQGEKWDDLISLEAERQQLVTQLKANVAIAAKTANGDEQAQINALIREILELDEKTRALVEHCMSDIRESLGAVGVSRQLASAYLRP